VGAFHNVSAVLLEDPTVERVDTDVLVLGDDREATDLVQALADVVPGMRGLFGGRLRNAHQVEALTANLISVNRRYKAHAGVRMTDAGSRPLQRSVTVRKGLEPTHAPSGRRESSNVRTRAARRSGAARSAHVTRMQTQPVS
jgi:hypothetical protein